MCIHCYPDGFQYASVCHKAIAKCFIKRCKGNKIFFNDSSHVTIFALADTNTFHTPKLKQFGLRIVYAGIGGILLPHTNTLFRGYKSKLFSLSKKSKSPIVRIPSSFRRGMMWSLTMIIFLKESSMLISDRDSCISFSLSGIDKADCT